MSKTKIFTIFCILLVATWNVSSAPNICDKGCEKNLEECPEERPCLCKRSWWPDRCVTENFGFRECGGTAERYCHECDAGCFSQEELDKHPVHKGDCHPGIPGTQRCKDDEYCCMKTSLIKPNECISEEQVSKGYDFGCCGGLSLEWEFKEGAILIADEIKNTDPNCVGKEYQVKWEVKAKDADEFVDYSSFCDEGDYTKRKLKLDLDESIKNLTCRSTKIPSYYDGPHTARISWCNGRISKEFEYGYGEEVPGELAVSIIHPKDGERFAEFTPITFEGKVSGGKAPYTYEWSIDGNVVETMGPTAETIVSFIRSDLSPSNHVIELTVTDNDGVTSKDTAEITIVEGLYVSITSPNDGDAFIKGSRVTFTSSVVGGTPPYIYTWDIGGKKSSGSKWWSVGTRLDYLSLGENTVTLEVTDDEGKTGTDSITIEIPIECEKGRNDDVPCEYWRPNQVIYDKDQITVCDPEPPMKEIINEWILSNSTLREQVKQGYYDDAVRKIWEKTYNDLYYRDGWEHYGYKKPCDQLGKRPASSFIDKEYIFNVDTKFEDDLNKGIFPNELNSLFQQKGYTLFSPTVTKISDGVWRIIPTDSPNSYTIEKLADIRLDVYRRAEYGVCRQWSAVLLSLIRTLGVPEHRVYIWAFGVERGVDKYGNPWEEGHHITAYLSATTGKWWILDTTCCQELVDLDSWRSTCPYECVCQTSRWFYVNDYKGYRWDDTYLFAGACEYNQGDPRYGLMKVEHTFPKTWIK